VYVPFHAICIASFILFSQLIHKVRNGQRIEDSVEDIINQAVGELRKNAFGEDADDAKSLPWAREQVWFIVSALAKQPKVGSFPRFEDSLIVQ
jgi:hypothetical protein